MRTATLFLAGCLALPTIASAQSTRSVLMPPNAIDRATAQSDQRNADARRAAEVDRLSAATAAPDRDRTIGSVPQSTMTDTATGFGTSQEIGAPVAPAGDAPRP